MGRVEAAMAALTADVRRHRRLIYQYLGTFMTFSERADRHRFDTNNPHGIRKDTLGLENIENYPIADGGDVLDPTLTDRYLDLNGSVTLVQAKYGQTHAFVTPTLLSPASGALVSSRRPTLIASGYHNHYGLTRRHREFRIVDQNTQEVQRFESVEDHLSVPVFLEPTHTYRWTVRDIAVDHSSSKWAPELAFEVPGFQIAAPTITLLSGTTEQAPMSPAFRTSTFVSNGPDDQHIETRWALYQGALQSPLWTLASTGGNLTSAAIPTGILEPEQTYRLEVCHVSALGGPTEMATLTFRTRSVMVQPPSVRLRGQSAASPLTPTFDLPPSFEVVGDEDTLLKVEVTLVSEDGVLLWGKQYVEEPYHITPDIALSYDQTYRLRVRYHAQKYGPSEVSEVVFHTTTGGSRGYSTGVPRTPDASTQFGMVSLDGRWLEVRGRQMRSHRYGEVQWTRGFSEGRVLTGFWSQPLDRYVIAFVPEVGAHRLLYLTLQRDGSMDGVLAAMSLPSGREILRTRYHGSIEGYHHFTTDTDLGVVYTRASVTEDQVEHRLIQFSNASTITGQFLSVMGQHWLMGATTSEGQVLLRGSYQNTDLLVRITTDPMMDGWGYRVRSRDLDNRVITLDRGDRRTRITEDLSVLSIEDISRDPSGVTDSDLRLDHLTDPLLRPLRETTYNRLGPVKEQGGYPTSLMTLQGPHGLCSVLGGHQGGDGYRLHIGDVDRTLQINDFVFDQLPLADIPQLVGYTWQPVPLYRYPRGSITMTAFSGVTQQLITTPTAMDIQTSLADAQALWTTAPSWESLVPFYQ